MSALQDVTDPDPPLASPDGMAGRGRTLAGEVKRRRSELGLSQIALSRQGMVSLATIGAIERGERRWFQATTLANLDRALGWSVGTAQGLLDEQHADAEHPAAVMPPEVVSELQRLGNMLAHQIEEATVRRRPADETLAATIDALDATERALLLHLARFLLDHRPR